MNKRFQVRAASQDTIEADNPKMANVDELISSHLDDKIGECDEIFDLFSIVSGKFCNFQI